MTATIKLGLINVMQLRILLLRKIQVVLELMKKQTKDHSQVLVLNAKDSLKNQMSDQRQLSTEIAQETFQTATVQTEPQVLTAAEQMKAF
jgi:hypothetical protein